MLNLSIARSHPVMVPEAYGDCDHCVELILVFLPQILKHVLNRKGDEIFEGSHHTKENLSSAVACLLKDVTV